MSKLVTCSGLSLYHMSILIIKIPPFIFGITCGYSRRRSASARHLIRSRRKANGFFADPLTEIQAGESNPGKAFTSCLLYAYNLIIMHDKRQFIPYLVILLIVKKAVNVAVRNFTVNNCFICIDNVCWLCVDI